MTLTEAAGLVGAVVDYRPPLARAELAGDRGVITSVNDRYVFVRYGFSDTPQATPAGRLRLVSVPAPVGEAS